MAAQKGSDKANTSNFFKGVRAEMRKVIWPTRKELVNYTSVVVLMTFVVGLIVWVLDLGINKLLTLIIK